MVHFENLRSSFARWSSAVLLLSTLSLAQTVTPPVVEAYPLGSGMSWSLSQEFKVEIHDGTNWVDANARGMARLSEDPWFHQGLYPWVHWVTVGAADAVRVRVSKQPTATRVTTYSSVAILPSRYGITPGNVTATSFEFTALRGQKVHCAINNQDIDSLFVFVNPPKPPIPSPLPSDWLYYPPGWSAPGSNYSVPANVKTIYLDGGAWVSGGFNLANTTGAVSIVGPGFLVGTVLDAPSTFRPVGGTPMPEPQRHDYILVRHETGVYSQNASLTMDGPTLVVAPYYNLFLPTMLGRKSFRNVQILSPWWYNTDGFLLASNADISDCFVFNNDNKLTPEFCNNGNLTVKSCVFAGRSSFNVGYGYFQNSAGNHADMSSIDLILQRGRIPFVAELDGANPGILVENQRYNDIDIVGDVCQLMSIRHHDVSWMPGSGTYGSVRRVVFRNVRLAGTQFTKSVISSAGGSPAQTIECIFDNLFINGTKVTAANCGTYFQTFGANVTVVFR